MISVHATATATTATNCALLILLLLQCTLTAVHAQICLTFGIWLGHSQRMFPIQRTIVTMDELVKEDEPVGYNARVSILIPSAGERLDIVMLALLGAMSQRCWNAGTSSKVHTITILCTTLSTITA
jgi:hypothetical protein